MNYFKEFLFINFIEFKLFIFVGRNHTNSEFVKKMISFVYSIDFWEMWQILISNELNVVGFSIIANVF